jgi:hypothetical protein
MGMDQTVGFPGRTPPAWPAVAGLLAQNGFAVQMRMIDGELSFPDEALPEGWREIRVGSAGAMVTIRRQAEQVMLVTWGNADRGQRELWNALAWAWAAAGAGLVQTPEGPVDASTFAAKAELPAAMRD